jgi:hypothetical protein
LLQLSEDYFTKEIFCIFPGFYTKDRMARMKKTLNPPFKPPLKLANASVDEEKPSGDNKTTEEIKKERRRQAMKEALELGMIRRQQAIKKEIDLAVEVMAVGTEKETL